MEICFLLHLEPPSILNDLTHELKIVSSTHKEFAVIRVKLLLNLVTSDLWTTKCSSTCPSPTPNFILRTLLLKTLINFPHSSLLPLPLAPLAPLPRDHLRRRSHSLFSPPRRLLRGALPTPRRSQAMGCLGAQGLGVVWAWCARQVG